MSSMKKAVADIENDFQDDAEFFYNKEFVAKCKQVSHLTLFD